MTQLTVLTVPDARLRIKAKPVSVVDDKIRSIFDDMVDTMHVEDGAGLAATQVGISLRLVTIDYSWTDEPPVLYKMVNPEIIWKSAETQVFNEGCLSVPDQRAEVTRPAAVHVRYLDENGAEHTIEADEYLAACVQHEIDHLDGKLYIDYLSPLKRTMMINKVKRSQRVY